jgi:hypothetical protein
MHMHGEAIQKEDFMCARQRACCGIYLTLDSCALQADTRVLNVLAVFVFVVRWDARNTNSTDIVLQHVPPYFCPGGNTVYATPETHTDCTHTSVVVPYLIVVLAAI